MNDTRSAQMDLLVTGAARLHVPLGLAQLEQFRRYYDDLVAWNNRVNLTSVTDWEEVQTRHFLDSLTVILAVPPALLESGRFLDVGSGAGLPGVPLKIAFPGLTGALMDATAKKTAFLAHIVQALGLEGVEALTGRAEDLAHQPGLREAFDLVLARAVAGMPALAELTLPFCRMGGLVVTQKSTGSDEEIEQARNAIATLGGTLRGIREIHMEGLMENRVLVVVEKVRATPQRYPRRAGIPAKRPL